MLFDSMVQRKEGKTPVVHIEVIRVKSRRVKAPPPGEERPVNGATGK